MCVTEALTAPLPTLEVAVCTVGAEGIARVSQMLPERQEGVSYLVSWQRGEGCDVPQRLASRRDVRIVMCGRNGLSANRNNALDNACGDIVLIADDDLVYKPGAFDAVRRAFAEHPEVGYATFMHDGPGERFYPAEETRLGLPLPRKFFQTSFEVALRRNSRAGRLRYCERFGLGSGRYICGEEELLLRKAIRSGIDCRFFPVVIVAHPGVSTGFNPSMRDGVSRVRGVLTVMDHPLTWPARTLARCWRADGRRGGWYWFRGAVDAGFSPWLRRYMVSKQVA